MTAIGNGAAFRKGREWAAWIGLVPREHSTSVVQGSRAVLQQRTAQSSGLQLWLTQLSGRVHQSVVVVALANKLARMAWAVLVKNERDCPRTRLIQLSDEPNIDKLGFRLGVPAKSAGEQ